MKPTQPAFAIARNPVAVRHLARDLGGVGLSAAWLVGVGAAGRWC
jgi:hypothetical protein